MIWLNFLRDLKSTLSRMVSVTIITILAVMVYVALRGILYNVNLVCDQYFEEQNVADYWLSGINLDEDDCRVLEEIAGVTGVQPRVFLDAHDKEDSSISLALYAAPSHTINLPYLIEGSLPSSEEEMLVSDTFASAHNLAVGDWYEMTVTGTGYDLRLQISGLAKSAELMRHVSATTPSTDLSRYGFAYLDSAALEGLMGPGRYNQICITVDEDLNSETLRQEIDSKLGEKVYSVMALEDNFSAYSFQGSTNDLAPVLNLFPILFFLCAILMMVSNMSRLIEGARQNIGTFKALGYRDGTILWYYLLHAALVVVVGFPIGALPSKLLTKMVVDSLSTGCDLPSYALANDYSAWAQAFVIITVCCVGSAFLVARSALKESPAQSMRPKPPKSTKPVLLEYVPAVWRRLTFNQKYIIRNTLRNKARMLTCIVGIAFCMALVLAAFGLQDAVARYADALTTSQNRYDVMAVLHTGVTEEEYQSFSDLDSVAAVEYEMTTYCWLYSGEHLSTATLQVAEDTPTLRLYDPYAGSFVSLPEDGMVLEKSVAQTLDVGVGDMVTTRFPGEDQTYEIQVVEINRSVSGAYVGKSFWNSLDREYIPTTAYLTAVDQEALTQELDNSDFVDAWQTREVMTDAAAEKLTSASLVTYVMIIFGGGLACVVIYNLGIMSFFEQIRGLATLMVLGFYDREIKRLQLSENFIYACIGIVLGLPSGIALTSFFVVVLKDFPLTVCTKASSYLISVGLTMLFALAVNFVIGRKMRDIDMLGALKSVE